MNVADYLCLFTETYNLIIRLFDYYQGEVVYETEEEFYLDENFHRFADCEVGSVDVYFDAGKKKICVEINISIDEIEEDV